MQGVDPMVRYRLARVRDAELYHENRPCYDTAEGLQEAKDKHREAVRASLRVIETPEHIRAEFADMPSNNGDEGAALRREAALQSLRDRGLIE